MSHAACLTMATGSLARTYGLIDPDQSEMRSDVEIVKLARVEAIAKSHLNP